MIRRISLWISGSFIFVAAVIAQPGPGGPGASPPKLSPSQFAAQLDSFLAEKTRADEFSGVVLVAKDGNPIYQKPVGLANKTYQIPNRIDTRFNLGSINKVFTKIAIGQLAEQGKLKLTDTLGKILPDYPNIDAKANVTIDQLIAMKSGIGDFFGEKFMNTAKDQIRNLSDYLPFFADQPLLFRPGTDEKYSNGGYVVLGLIIEKLSGHTYYDYVREHIFKPAGMDSTDSYEPDDLPPNTATGYTTEMDSTGPRRANIYTLPGRGSSAGGGYSMAGDLLRFAQALASGKLLGPEYLRWVSMGIMPGSKPLRPGPVPIGLGVAGGSPGVNAVLDIDSISGYTVVVLANYDPPAAGQVARRIRSMLPGDGEKKVIEKTP